MAEIDYNSIGLGGLAYNPASHIDDATYFKIYAQIEGYHSESESIALTYESSNDDDGTFNFVKNVELKNFSTYNADDHVLDAKVWAEDVKNSVDTKENAVQIEEIEDRLRVKEANKPTLSNNTIFIDNEIKNLTSLNKPTFKAIIIDNSGEDSFTTWAGGTKVGYSGLATVVAKIYEGRTIPEDRTGGISLNATFEESEGYYTYQFVPTENLQDGDHILVIDATDNDENSATFSKTFSVAANKPNISNYNDDSTELTNAFTNAQAFDMYSKASRIGGSDYYKFVVKLNDNFVKFTGTDNYEMASALDSNTENDCMVTIYTEDRDADVFFNYNLTLKDNWTNVIQVYVYDQYGNVSSPSAISYVNCSTKAIVISDVKFATPTGSISSSETTTKTCKISCKVSFSE